MKIVVKIKRNLKHPFLIGVIGLVIIFMIIWGNYMLYNKKNIQANITTEEHDREKNISKIKTPAEAVYYFLSAVQKDDLDRAMRGYAIGEISQKTVVANLIKSEGMFYADLALAPTLNYKSYFAYASAELTGEYAKKYTEFDEAMSELRDAEIYKIIYEPMEEEEEKNSVSLAQDIGAEQLVKMLAYLKKDDQLYKIEFWTVQYKSYWRIYDSNPDIQLTSEKDFEKINEIKTEEKKDYEKINKKTKKIIKNEEGILAVNFTWSNATYGDSVEKLMKEFTKYVQKNSTGVLLTFGNVGEKERNLDHIDTEQLINRGEFAKCIKYFYYTLMLEQDANKKEKIDNTTSAADKIIKKLNPQYLFYLDLLKLRQIDDGTYYAYFKYEGNYYRFKFEFKEFEKGWQIKDITNGKVMTREEYDMDLQEE